MTVASRYDQDGYGTRRPRDITRKSELLEEIFTAAVIPLHTLHPNLHIDYELYDVRSTIHSRAMLPKID